MSIRIETLGRVGITSAGKELQDLTTQRVRCALLLYLALERTATRDTLTAVFWPDRDSDRARHSLSQTLYELRRILGDHWLQTQGERLQCVGVAVDALDFVAAVEAHADDDALELYRGHFLEGCHLGTTPAFEQWVEARRSALSRLHRTLCRRLTAARAERRDLDGALEAARRWVDADVLDDEAQHRLIELLAEAGRRSSALRQFELYQDVLARELGVEPLDGTRELVNRIRAVNGAETGAQRAAGSGEREESQLGAATSGSRALPESASSAAAASSMAGIGGSQDSARHAGGGGIVRAVMTSSGARRSWVLGSLALLLASGTVMLWRVMPKAAPAAPHHAGIMLDSLGIAVLPFTNMSADPEKEYFSEGITEDLLTHLSRIEHLRVISRTSVMRYRRTERPIGEIARELGVRYVLEGSVRRDGDQVRISAQLIDAATDSHLWAEHYDRELTGIFQIQSEIAQRIADALRHRLSPADRMRIAAGGTSNLDAYDLVLRGREYLNRPGDADLRKFPPALGYFRRALEADSAYARAHVGISEAFRRHLHLPLPLAVDSAIAYARTAVLADPELAEAAAALGAAYALAGRAELAEPELRRALALDPSLAEARAGLARLAALNGRLDEAVRWQRGAVAVDPSSPSRLVSLGEFLFDLGDLTGAEHAFRRAVDFAPDYPEPSYLLAQIHLIRGEPQQADAQMTAMATSASGHPATPILMGRYHAHRGRYAEAEEQLERASTLGSVLLFRTFVAKKTGGPATPAALLREPLERLHAARRAGVAIPPRALLHTQALVGDRHGALATLEEHWRTGLRSPSGDPPEVGVYWIDAEPMLEDLRDDPSFQALLRRMRAELDSMRLLSVR